MAPLSRCEFMGNCALELISRKELRSPIEMDALQAALEPRLEDSWERLTDADGVLYCGVLAIGMKSFRRSVSVSCSSPRDHAVFLFFGWTQTAHEEDKSAICLQGAVFLLGHHVAV